MRPTRAPGTASRGNETLGTVGTVGFVLLGVVALVAVAGTAAGRGDGDWTRRYRPAALGAVLAVALGTTGGVSALIAFLVTPDLRAWNRISVFIAFFSLLAVGCLPRAGASPGCAPAWRPGCSWSCSSSGASTRRRTSSSSTYTVAGHAYRSDLAFGRAVEALLPRGSSVLELPYVPFPEGYHIPGATPHKLLRHEL